MNWPFPPGIEGDEGQVGADGRTDIGSGQGQESGGGVEAQPRADEGAMIGMALTL
jgi:hypothetical protein